MAGDLFVGVCSGGVQTDRTMYGPVAGRRSDGGHVARSPRPRVLPEAWPRGARRRSSDQLLVVTLLRYRMTITDHAAAGSHGSSSWMAGRPHARIAGAREGRIPSCVLRQSGATTRFATSRSNPLKRPDADGFTRPATMPPAPV